MYAFFRLLGAVAACGLLVSTAFGRSNIPIDQGSGERAVLYEDDVNNPQEQKQFVGSVACRFEQTKGADGRASDIAMHVDVEIPDRKLKMTLSLRASIGPSGPTPGMELAFSLPPDFPGGGIDAVPAILMTSSEQEPGTPLAGLVVKATDGSFRLDFSNLDAEGRARNAKLAHGEDLFHIPLIYANGHHAFIVIDGSHTSSCERAAKEASIASQESLHPKDQSRFTPGDQASERQSGGSASKTSDESQEQSRHPPKDPSRFTPGDQASIERAALYEEDPSDPKGLQAIVGSVVWRAERINGADKASDIAVRADIEIPDRKLKMTMLFQRNTDPKLPASHTMELTFSLPPDFWGGDVSKVVGVMMKSDEHSRGMNLVGDVVKVTDGDFLVAFSNTDEKRSHNLRYLKERSWFDISVICANQRRAIITIEKGASGERAFDRAFAAWGE